MFGAIEAGLQSLSLARKNLTFPESIVVESLHGIPKLVPKGSKVPLESQVELEGCTVEIVGGAVVTGPLAVKRTVRLDLRVSERDSQWDHWAPGDAVGILAPNSDCQCDHLLNLLARDCAPEQRRLLFRELKYFRSLHLGKYIKKATLKYFADSATSAMDRNRLLYLISKEGAATLVELCALDWSVADLLNDFPSCRPPLSALVEHLPPLRRRYYSICTPRTYSKTNGFDPLTRTFSICFNVVDYTTDAGVRRKGQCTGYLESLLLSYQSGDDKVSLRVVQRHRQIESAQISRFNAPLDFEQPLILVGPGTGVAPLIGMAAERALYARHHPELKLAPIYLVHGCRHIDDEQKFDWLFTREMKALLPRVAVVLAVSRETPKVSDTDGIQVNANSYVQTVFKTHAKEFANLLHLQGDGEQKQAALYFCGDAMQMAKSFNDSFLEFVRAYKGDKANGLVSEWRKCLTYRQELW